jgi:hypothetical protein
MHTIVARLIGCAWIVLVLVTGPAPAAAQEILGTVLDHASEEPLQGVRVTLEDEEGATAVQTLTDERGRFYLAAPAEGSWRVATDLFGFLPLVAAPLEIARWESLVVEIRLAPQVIALDPLVVTARRTSISPDVQRFYERLERGRHFGLGQFVSRADVERTYPIRTTDLLRSMAGVRLTPGPRGMGDIVRMAGDCVPAIYVDGSLINRTQVTESLDAHVIPHDVEGIEVYRGSGSMIAQYHDPRGCGLILVWTRRGEIPNNGVSWWKAAAILLAFGGIVFLLN